MVKCLKRALNITNYFVPSVNIKLKPAAPKQKCSYLYTFTKHASGYKK